MLSFSYIFGNSLIDSDELKKKNSIIKTARGKQLLWEVLGQIVKF